MSDRDNITLPREVVQEAVEALVEARALLYDGRKQDKAATALRTALAAEQPKPEPVAYFDLQKQVFYWAKPTQIDVPMIIALEPLPLFTAPPDAEALRRDAERYRWVLNWLWRYGLLSREKTRIDTPESFGDWFVLRKPHSIGLSVGYGKTEDAAIDAAMKEAALRREGA